MRYVFTLLAGCLTVVALATGAIGTLAEEGAATSPPLTQVQSAPPPRAENCLTAADLREAVAERRVIEPVAAIRAARTVIPRAEIQRASLCRHDEGLVYMLTALRRDGHFVHVMVDAKTGEVAGQY
ncbi:PepSY domain-containing protein [Methylobacterium planeticum]|uniref:PepSY domain-containing protein n=1 Tax=Methylobacterium planeticum TaxID=2615211 RepID=A0A6N6MRN6_9HYPH|nr:PepSY domain-containing protein [Methylobacterium planeticum]KAB1072839.1 PepSY domain-containing protein [Methylobacterium planeticum]